MAIRAEPSWLVAVPAIVLSIALSPGTARAQGLGLLSGGTDPLAGEIAEREAVLETLRVSFVRAQQVRLVRVREDAGDDLVPFDEERDLNRARENFLSAANERLYALEGDGSLTLGEVADELPSIRDEHLRRFENVVEARSRGYAPPPLREGSDSYAAHAVATARYIVFVRNAPVAWARLALYAGAGVLIALLLSGALTRLARRVAAYRHASLASALDGIRLPLVLAASAVGLRVGLDTLWLPAGVEEGARSALAIAIIALAFLACWNLSDKLGAVLARTLGHATGEASSEHTRGLLQRASRVLVLVAFLVVVSRVVLDVSLTGLLAGLGIVGVGLWIVTRGLVENVAASFTLFGDRVFRIGDTIVHKEQWGVIESIGFRSTRCRTLDGHLLHIPNRNLVDDTIWNVSARPGIRRRFRLSLEYGACPDTIETAIGLVHAAIDERGDAIDRDAGVHVVFDAFGDHDLQLLVQYHTASDDYWTAEGVIGDVNLGIHRRFADAGIALAFPTRTTVLESARDTPPLLRVVDAGTHPDDGTPDADADTRRSGKPAPDEPGEGRWRDGPDGDERAA